MVVIWDLGQRIAQTLPGKGSGCCLGQQNSTNRLGSDEQRSPLPLASQGPSTLANWVGKAATGKFNAADNGPVKTAARAITDVETSIQTHMGELTAHVNAAAASQTAAATSETKANLWAEQPENTTVAPGAYSALHHAAKADASRIKAGQWAETPEDQAVEPGKFSARHWAAKAQVFAQGKPEFHAIAVTAGGNLIWTHGTTGTFSPDDYAAWWLVPQGVSISINPQGHMEVTI